MERMIEHAYVDTIWDNTHSAGDIVHEIDVTLESGQTLYVSIAFLAYPIYTTDSNNSPVVTEMCMIDYDISIYRGQTPVSFATTANTTLEYTKYTATSTATYTISIDQYSDIPPNIDDPCFCISYFIEV